MWAQSGLAIVFYPSHSELSDAPMYRKLEWLVYCILLSVLQVTTRLIDNFNGLCIVFYCSHSAHQLTTRPIIRLLTRSGSPQ